MLLNRRGFATAIFCRQCAATMDCPNCSVSLIVHGEGPSRRARCHYCNYTMRVPAACPQCAGPVSRAGGLRHRARRSRSEAPLSGRAGRAARSRHHPPQRRADGDSREVPRRRDRRPRRHADDREGARLSARHARRRRLGRRRPRPGGLPRVRADVSAADAGRRAAPAAATEPGEAIVQTIYPDHYSIQLARQQDYRAFFEKEIEFRKTMRYPPLVAMINTIVRSRRRSAAPWTTRAISCSGCARARSRRACGFSGPAPAPLGRLRGEYRTQVLLKGTNRQEDARGAAVARSRRAPISSAASSSTSIRRVLTREPQRPVNEPIA